MNRYRRAACAVGRRPPWPTHQTMGWWHANRVDTSVSGNGVAQWDDLSGSGRHLTQGTGANQPTWQRQGMYGIPAVRGDGSNDRLFNTSSAPFDLRTKAAYVYTFATTAAVTDKYIIGQADTTAGQNGPDVRLSGGGGGSMVHNNKSNTTSNTTSIQPEYITSLRATSIEYSWDFTRTSTQIGTGTGPGFNYGTVGGANLDASAGQFGLFDFASTGFSSPAAIDFHEVFLMTRPLSASERRRHYRRVTRMWQARHPNGFWHDGTLTTAL